MKACTVIFVLMMSVVLLADIPAPKSFYDFEETEGGIVIDQGEAANNGVIYDGNGWLQRNAGGGIYSKPTDGRRCIEFVEENAFGELCYVAIPYKEFMNAPNYTFSAWIMYNGTPNWGYVFWMGGATWPENPMERHVDVWLNPGANGLDCILNAVDGGQPRIATSEAECGIGVMDGDWHLVAITLKDGVSLKMYIDGIVAAELEAAAEIVENSSNPELYLGARPNNADATTAVKIVGWMDRVRIWDVALDEAQIADLAQMEGPSGGTLDVADRRNMPQNFGLVGNYPNPFNPSTTISYSLDRNEQVALDVYDMLGNKIRTLFSGVQTAGRHEIQWNGMDENGRQASSGLYIYTLKAGDRTDYGKMTLLK